jgi:hypothetical protein
MRSAGLPAQHKKRMGGNMDNRLSELLGVLAILLCSYEAQAQTTAPIREV